MKKAKAKRPVKAVPKKRVVPRPKLALYHEEREWMAKFYRKTKLGALQNWHTYTQWKQQQMAKPRGKKR